MTDAISIARSGLTAQKQRLAAIANNIANLGTAGPPPQDGAAASSSGPAVYRPLQVSQSSLAINGQGAGVKATVEEVPEDQAYTVIFDPQSALASEEGFVAIPNISLEEQIVDLQIAKHSYKANAKLIGVVRAMEDEVLNILA